MILKEFYQGKDYQQYPEAAFIRNHPKVAHILGASKPHEQLVFAQLSKWWHSSDEGKLHIKNLLAYNSGVVFSFGASHYQIDLNYDLMNEILEDEVKTPYLQFRIYSPDLQIKIKQITVKIGDSVIDLNPLDAIYKNVDFDAKTRLEIDKDGNLVVTKLKEEYNLYFDLIFRVPEYNKLELVKFLYDGYIKILVYNSPVSALVYSGTEGTIIQVDKSFLLSKSRDDLIGLMQPPVVYQNVGIIYDSKVSSKHLALYLDMKFYDPNPDPEYTAVRAIQLVLEPVEKAFVKFYQRKYHDIISLGTFHKMHDNLFLLFKNSVVFPAFTEYTVYQYSIHLPALVTFLKNNDYSQYGDLTGSDFIGKYDLAYLHDVYQYEYPYGLELIRKDFDYFDYGTQINYQTDELMYVNYEIYDRDAVVIDLDFEPKQVGKVLLGKEIKTEIEYPAILWKLEHIPVRKFSTDLSFDHKHRATINSVEFSNIIFDHYHITRFPVDSEIIYSHSHTKE